MADIGFQGPFSGTTYLPQSVAAGTPIAVGRWERKTVSLESVGTETIQVQISCDPSATPAASSWINEQAALTAAGSVEISKPCAWVRFNVTAWTSGTPTARLAGVNRA